MTDTSPYSALRVDSTKSVSAFGTPSVSASSRFDYTVCVCRICVQGGQGCWYHKHSSERQGLCLFRDTEKGYGEGLAWSSNDQQQQISSSVFNSC